MNSVRFDDLKRDGFVRIPKLICSGQIEVFERTMSQLAENGLRRKSIDAGNEEAMSALLKSGGRHRTRLFTNLKYLRIVQEMGDTVRRRITEAGFLEWADMQIPAIWPILRADPPGETKYLLPYHQDFATQCLNAWRIWIPMRHANAERGTMEVVPASHRRGYIEHDSSDRSCPTIPKELLDGQEPVVLDVEPGDGIILNPLLFHASVPATENVMKYVLMVQVQDMATIADEDNPADILAPRLALAEARDLARN